MISLPEACSLSSLEEAGAWGGLHKYPDCHGNPVKRSDPRTIKPDNGKAFLFPSSPLSAQPKIRGPASLSRGLWNNGAGAPLCRKSPLTGAEQNGLIGKKYIGRAAKAAGDYDGWAVYHPYFRLH